VESICRIGNYYLRNPLNKPKNQPDLPTRSHEDDVVAPDLELINQDLKELAFPLPLVIQQIFWVKDVQVTKILKKTPTQTWVDFGEKDALVLPNFTENCDGEATYAWRCTVSREVQMRGILKKIGLLGLPRTKVRVFRTDELKMLGRSVPAFLTETFKTLEARGIYVIGQTPNKDKRLFKSRKEALDPTNWKGKLDGLHEDIVKLILHQIPTQDESLHVALVKDQVRYFGFDFPAQQADKTDKNPLALSTAATHLFSKLLIMILLHELNKGYPTDEGRALYEQLREGASKRYYKRFQNCTGTRVQLENPSQDR